MSASQSGLRLLLSLLLLFAFACAGREGRGAHAGSTAPSAAELYRAGEHFLAASDLTRAEQYFASALRQGYDSEACTRALITTTLRASRLRSALLYAEPALLARPGDVPLRVLVATILLALGEAGEAERELRRALSLEETRPEAHYLLALVLGRRAGAQQERLGAFARYLELAPAGPHAEEARAALREAAREAQQKAEHEAQQKAEQGVVHLPSGA